MKKVLIVAAVVVVFSAIALGFSGNEQSSIGTSSTGALTDGWTDEQKEAGVRQTDEAGLGGN